MKRIISFILCLSIMLGVSSTFVGCKKSRWGKDITVLTAISTYKIPGTQWGDDPVSRAITEKTKIALDIEYTVGDFDEKLGGMIMAESYPDLILSIDNYQLRDLVNGGAVLDWDNFLANGGENVKNTFGSLLPSMEYTDGKIYGVNKDFGEVPSIRDWYVQIQYPVLKALNYPEINTLDDVSRILKQYLALPENAANKSLIPLLVPAGGDTIRHGISNAAMRTAGFQDDGEFVVDASDLEDIKVKYALTTDGAKDYLKWLNKANADKLLSMDSFNMTSHNMVVEKVAQGNVLCVIEPDWALKETEAALRSDISGMPDKCYAKIPVYSSEAARQSSQVSNYDSLGTWKSVITKNCKNPDKAFEFFNYMWSEEAQTMAWWGIEGENYDMVDGKRVLKEKTLTDYQTDGDFRIKTGISLYNYWSCGAMVKDSSGQFINPFLTPAAIAKSYTPQDKAMLKEYYNILRNKQIASSEEKTLPEYDAAKAVWADLWPTPKKSPWGFAWKITLPRIKGAAVQPSRAQVKLKDEINLVAFQDMITSNVSLFDTKWNAYVNTCYSDTLVNTLTGGIRPLEQQYETAIAERLLKWYGADWKTIVKDMME